jgi:hypothetical protein
MVFTAHHRYSEEAMKYACLVYHEEHKLDALSASQLGAIITECGAWVEDLQRRGHHVFSAALQSVRTATTVRNGGSQPSMTDGPFAETKEFLGGFTIITARDLNEALQLVANCPAWRIGSIEVRPVLEADSAVTDPLDRKLGAALGAASHP